MLDPNCVPYDIFNPGGVTQDALDYLQTPGLRNGQTTQYVVSGSVTADLGKYGFRSPLATDGVGIAVGAEYRKDKLELNNDVSFLTGDLAGQGTPFGVRDAKGATTVKEVFGEIRVPLVQDRPFFDELTFEGSYRHSSYKLSGSTNAYKLALEYAPTPDVRLRASYNRAVRAPNVLELFSPATIGLFSSARRRSLRDRRGRQHCGDAGTVPSHRRDPGPVRLHRSEPGRPVQPAHRRLRGPDPGNLGLVHVGLVLTPRFLPRFNASIDFYSIKIKDVIGTFGADFTLSQCVDTGNPVFCNRINRTPSGSLFTGTSFIDNPNANLGGYKTTGIDINAGYRTPLGPLGNRRVRLRRHLPAQVRGDPVAGRPHRRHVRLRRLLRRHVRQPAPEVAPQGPCHLLAEQEHQRVDRMALLRRGRQRPEANDPLVGGGEVRRSAGSHSAHQGAELLRSRARRDGGQDDLAPWRRNIFDRQPPISPGYSNNGSNTFAQVYDSLGRYIYTSVTLDF